MNKKVIIAFLVMLVLSVVVIVGFYEINHNGEKPKAVTETSEIGKLMNKDLEAEYPATPREVVKFYNRINSVMYNEEVSEENFETLLNQMRFLFDEELLAENPYEDHLKAFKKERESYKEEKKSIVSYNIPENSSVKYYTSGGKEMASLIVGYMLKDRKDYSKMNEEFILRQDEDENWKIVGWQIDE